MFKLNSEFKWTSGGIEIPDTDPFQNDLLNRGEAAAVLTQLVEKSDTPFVLQICGSFGLGKTTFARMWKKLLEIKGFDVVYHDAWRNDFATDPLLPLISELTEKADDSFRKDNGKGKEALRKMRLIAGSAAKRAAPQLIKLATAGVVDLEKDFQGALSEVLEKAAERAIDDFEKQKTSIRELRLLLEETVGYLSLKTGKPLVFFIDELDRCRPNYAIELIERIKHVLDIKNVAFVLFVDKEQLEISIRSQYGDEFDSKGYLRRFIDLDYNLPRPAITGLVSTKMSAIGFTEYINKNFEGYEASNFEKCLCESSHAWLSTPRDIGRSLNYANVVIRLVNSRENCFARLIGFLSVLRIRDTAKFDRVFNHDLSVLDQIKSKFHETAAGARYFQSNDGDILEAFLRCALIRNMDNDESVKEMTPDQNSGKHDARIRTIIGEIFARDQQYHLKGVMEALRIAGNFGISQ